MDPLTVCHMGRIRQQELWAEAEKRRYAVAIWVRLWDKFAPMIAARRQKARCAAEQMDTCVTATNAVVDNC